MLKAQYGQKKNPDSPILLDYDDDNFSQRYGQFKEAFRALTKEDNLTPYLSDNDFGSSNNGDDNGYNLEVFDIRYQKKLENAQPINADFNFSENVPAEVYGYALVLTKKLVSVSSDGQRHFDLVYI